MAATQFGQFTAEFFSKAGNAYSYVEDSAKAKVKDLSDKHPNLESALEWFTPEIQEKIAKVFFALGVVYNFLQNKLTFLGGTSLGILASAGKVPEWLRYESLEGLQPKENVKDKDDFKPLLSMKAEDGFQIQKMMTFLAFMNWYIGDTLLDNMFFGGFSGMVAGNCIYHEGKDSIDGKLDWFSNTAIGKSITNGYNSSADTIDSFVKNLFGKGD